MVSEASTTMFAEADENQTMFLENENHSLETNWKENLSVINECKFNDSNSFSELLNLFYDNNCRRHSDGFSIFLCVANFLILLCGFVGNSMVIYVVSFRIKKKTASTFFILNLAVADLLVILCCIPATLVANIFTPWPLGEIMCKIVAHAQGVSVFCSVYSLVAISFDRCRAIHQSSGLSGNISTSQTLKTILFIWLIGVTITSPWAYVFQVVHLPLDNSNNINNNILPFCREIWGTRNYELVYFLFIHVFLCFFLPFGMIMACNVIIWKGIVETHSNSGSTSNSSCVNLISERHRKRKVRVFKMFTCLTFVFFICWLPLYLIMARIKLFYNDHFTGYSWEKKFFSVLIPIAQLLGSCNSCVNPILYALLNNKFRESFKSIFVRPIFCKARSPSISVASRGDQSVFGIVVNRQGLRDTSL